MAWTLDTSRIPELNFIQNLISSWEERTILNGFTTDEFRGLCGGLKDRAGLLTAPNERLEKDFLRDGSLCAEQRDSWRVETQYWTHPSWSQSWKGMSEEHKLIATVQVGWILFCFVFFKVSVFVVGKRWCVKSEMSYKKGAGSVHFSSAEKARWKSSKLSNQNFWVFFS